jgi:hypothetical protein
MCKKIYTEIHLQLHAYSVFVRFSVVNLATIFLINGTGKAFAWGKFFFARRLHMYNKNVFLQDMYFVMHMCSKEVRCGSGYNHIT